MSLILLTSLPSTETIMSPSAGYSLSPIIFISETPFNPAISAGLPGTTVTIKNPFDWSRSRTLARSGSMSFPEIPIQIGGGIRDLNIANTYIEAGISYLIIGTMAVTHPEFVSELCREFPGKIIVGLDANNGLVAIDGWAKQTDINAVDLSKKFEQDGVSSIIYTDIARDGMLQGVNVLATVELAKKTTIPIIASGGIANLDDIAVLLKNARHGIIGAITGRAIYEGSLDFNDAQTMSDIYDR